MEDLCKKFAKKGKKRHFQNKKENETKQKKRAPLLTVIGAARRICRVSRHVEHRSLYGHIRRVIRSSACIEKKKKFFFIRQTKGKKRSQSQMVAQGERIDPNRHKRKSPPPSLSLSPPKRKDNNKRNGGIHLTRTEPIKKVKKEEVLNGGYKLNKREHERKKGGGE
jgi:hypothetical protein